MSDWWSDLINWLQRFLGLSPFVIERLIWTFLAWLVYFIFRLTVSFVVERRVTDVARQYLLRKSASYALGFAVIIATLVIWFGNLTGWAAYLGILSAGLAIALQDPVTNVAGWIFITIRKPFVVGDRIQIGEHRGDVIDMRLFQFSLIEIGNWVDADQSTGRIIHIPNGWVFKQSTANYTRGFNFIWNELAITITFESNWEGAKEILSEIATKHSILKSQEAQDQVRKAARKYLIYFQHLTPIVWTSVADNGVTLTVRYICDPRKRRSTEAAIWEDVLEAFGSRSDIDFAYPTTRFYNNVSEGKPEARAEPGVQTK
ncbi:MAG: mechanosensitive ion channel [Candidatus Latescibacteria bacterium]|nr:mechanosensitive ion channel [Candidatus Latescibacterota bacterium]NIO56266.1 mechanosensitive ion channel [Candidatus Latescibacterota bacterium]